MLKFSSNFYLKYRYLFLAKKDILKPSKNRAINQTKEGIHMEMNKNIEKWYELHTDEVNALSDDIWAHPEVGMQEHYAAKATAAFMRKYGFEVQELDAAMKGDEPNCVIAKWGSGKPVIGIIGELDALPGLGQEAVPYPSPKPGPGHGCGHNLMAAGCGAAACALKETMEAEGLKGTIVYLGCPAEETFEGKVHMIHNHLFDGIDVCLAWHPMGGAPKAVEIRMNACTNMIISFKGRTAHAGGDPHNGRSALDAAELMNVGVQYLREHVTSDVRMHYIYLASGTAPNIVPDFASLNYFVRAQSAETCRDVVARVRKIAEGAAMMTETEVIFEQKAAAYDTMPNFTLNQAMYDSAIKIPEITYTEDEINFAKEVYRNATGKEADHDLLPTTIAPPTGTITSGGGSTDVGDVSYIIPTVQFFGHCRLTGCPSHHWSTTACTGMSIGHKAQIYSGKVLAQNAYDLLHHPEIIEKAWEEHRKNLEGRAPYHCWLDDID